jgi:dTDP-4-amino-4,6-dideoxy-D-galactose acyltransferase
MAQSQTSVCESLPWDSEFFGHRIARLLPGRLSADVIDTAKAWCEANAIDCLYLLADANDPETIRRAEDNQFRLVDIRLTMSRKLSNQIPAVATPTGTNIRLATNEDIPALRAIARQSHHDSRFYFDPHFAPAQCDRLYETWIEKSCGSYADVVFVADHQGQPAGYITCKAVNPETGQIGLLAVGAHAASQGLGLALVASALEWSTGRNLDRAVVVTQCRNVPAQRCYQRTGFVTEAVQIWYHRWFVDNGTSSA